VKETQKDLVKFCRVTAGFTKNEPGCGLKRLAERYYGLRPTTGVGSRESTGLGRVDSFGMLECQEGTSGQTSGNSKGDWENWELNFEDYCVCGVRGVEALFCSEAWGRDRDAVFDKCEADVP
jgi:hypothetical protein